MAESRTMDRIEGWAVNEQREMPERGWSGQEQRGLGGGSTASVLQRDEPACNRRGVSVYKEGQAAIGTAVSWDAVT